ncbi:MAG TPA: hypothetical protein VGG01_22450 [Xanthobacteraceae bacterium]
MINYKVTGNIVGPGGCVGGVHPGFEEACAAFATGTPFTLTFSVNTGVKANTQNAQQACAATLAVDFNGGTIETTRTVALFSKAVSNINLQLANGVSYVGSGDVSLENDTCLASGVTATDIYNISAKMTGPNSFPSFSSGTATVGFVFTLAEVASAVDPNHPLPPTALQSLNLPDAHPEAHLLQDTSQQSILTFRFPNVGAVSWAVGLPISTFEVVP